MKFEKAIILLFLIKGIIIEAQNKPIEIGFDISIMRVQPNFYTEANQKVNTRFGGNIGYKVNKHYTIRIGLYNEGWDYLSDRTKCAIDPITKNEVCNNLRFDFRMNWWSIPILNELYVWKRRVKFIAAPNILLSKLYNDVSLMGGIGYNLPFSNYGLVKIEALYQSNKLELLGRSKIKPYSNILMLNIGIQYVL